MITFSLLLAMCTFSLAMSISPGPVNMVIVSSGVNYGIRRTMPFVSGATIGFTLLLSFIGLGFIQILESYPLFLKYLTLAGGSFIIYLGYKVAASRGTLSLPDENAKVAGFLDGFLLQWLNPKAWIASVSGASLFSNVDNQWVLITFIISYFIVCYGCLTFWALMGDKATLLFNNEKRLKYFNIVMGSLLIVTAVFLIHGQLMA